MRLLLIFAHPVADSFASALHQAALTALRGAGHEVDDCDLYAENFQPVLTREERINYRDTARNQAPVADYVARLRNCEGLVFVFPTWNHGMPAILKGYFDRVWIPGVAFSIGGGKTVPLLSHIKRFAVITTYGAPWWMHTFVFGNPNKRAFLRGLRRVIAHRARILWLAQYRMDTVTGAQRQAFLARVQQQLAQL